jgi:hypothetical protein
MAIRVVAAAFLSAVLMFLWGFVYWGPVLNTAAKVMAPLPAEQELDILAPMRSSKMPTGMYVHPGPLADQGDQAAVAAWEAQIKDGPILHLAYHAAGVAPMDPVMMAKGFAHMFVVALLAAALLAAVVHGLPTYASRVGVLFLVALIAAVWTNVANVIWWFHTPRYAAAQIIFQLVAGLLMALVAAAIVKPRAAAPAPATP